MDIYADRFEGFFLGYPAATQIGQQPYTRISLQGTIHTRPRPGSQTNIFGFFQLKAENEFQRNKFCFPPVRLMAHFVCFSFQQKNALAISHLTRD